MKLDKNSKSKMKRVKLDKTSKLNFSEIARLLNRDPRTIWTVYSRVEKKELEN